MKRKQHVMSSSQTSFIHAISDLSHPHVFFLVKMAICLYQKECMWMFNLSMDIDPHQILGGWGLDLVQMMVHIKNEAKFYIYVPVV